MRSTNCCITGACITIIIGAGGCIIVAGAAGVERSGAGAQRAVEGERGVNKIVVLPKQQHRRKKTGNPRNKKKEKSRRWS
jgi:hypothetical protein